LEQRIRFAALLLLSSVAFAAEGIEAFGHKWTVPLAADWKVEKQDGTEVLQLLVARPQQQPRRPIQFALADTKPFEKVTLEAEVKRDGSSLILVYAYKDASHFNYAHLSTDEATKQPVHNGIFHVYGGDRVRISQEIGPPSLTTEDWTKVRLTWDGKTGLVTVAVNGKELPTLRAVDLSLTSGKVGIGSFFEKALFRNVKILPQNLPLHR
jgi:hypothetical protein